MAVSNFKVLRSTLFEEELVIEFTFTNTDPNETGYKFQSLIDSVYTVEGYYDNLELYEVTFDDRDTVLTVTSPNNFLVTKTYALADIPHGVVGQFYFSVYNKLTGSFYSTVKVPYNFPVSPVKNLVSYYDGFNFNVRWDKVTEALISSYLVERAETNKINGFTIDYRDIFTIRFRHTSFKQDQSYVVFDLLNGYSWTAVCINQEELYISNDNLYQRLKFLNYNAYQSINFDIFEVNESSYTKVVEITQANFVDHISYNYTPDNTFSAFRVSTFGGALAMLPVLTFSRATVLAQVTPRLYPIYESTDIYSSSPYFNSMRSFLIDENYYYKNTFSLPYKSKSTEDYDTYNIRGNIGIGNAAVDLIIESEIVSTVKSDERGEFSFDFNINFKNTDLSIIAYDENRLQQSYVLTDVTFNKVVQYTFLGVLSYAFERVQKEVIEDTFHQFLLKQCSDEVLDSYFAPLTGLQRRQDDDPAKFRAQVEFLFPLLHISNIGGTVDLIRNIIQYYVNNDYGVAGYELYEHGDFLSTDHDSWVLDKSLITDKSRLGKNKYTYYVSASPKNFPSRKSAPVEIFCDYRLWDAPEEAYYFDEELDFDQEDVVFDQENYYPPLNFTWKPAGQFQEYTYHVYRKVNDGSIYRLTAAAGQDGIGFCDNGSIPGTIDEYPEFGYFDTPVIQDLKFVAGTILYDGFLLEYNPNYYIVIIYEEFEGAISEGVRERISTLLNNIAKPEQFFVTKYFAKI